MSPIFKRTNRKKLKREKFATLMDGIKRLVELKVAVVEKGVYTYSPEFEVSAKHIIRYPPRRIKQLSIGRKIARKIVPVLTATSGTYEGKRDIENMVVAYACLETHVKRLHIQISDATILELTHAVWYLNDHEPMAEEEPT